MTFSFNFLLHDLDQRKVAERISISVSLLPPLVCKGQIVKVTGIYIKKSFLESFGNSRVLEMSNSVRKVGGSHLISPQHKYKIGYHFRKASRNHNVPGKKFSEFRLFIYLPYQWHLHKIIVITWEWSTGQGHMHVPYSKPTVPSKIGQLNSTHNTETAALAYPRPLRP